MSSQSVEFISEDTDDILRPIQDLEYREFPADSLLELLFNDDKITGAYVDSSEVDSGKEVVELTLTLGEAREEAAI